MLGNAKTLARLLGMPYPETVGGSGQPYEVYLQALEEVAAAWLSVGIGVSVHVMSCYALATFGTPAQQQRYLPEMVGGRLLGAFAITESQAGSDVSAITTRAKRSADGYDLSGAKAWITHGSRADFYTTFARAGDDPDAGITCFHVPADSPGLSFGTPERKMGLTGSTTTSVYLDAVATDESQRIGDEGRGLRIALSALDSGRLGIAACATGLAQAALDLAADYAKQRVQFGRTIAEFQGLQFLLADMAAAVDTARAIVADLRQPFDVHGRELLVTASIGLSIASGTEDIDAEVVLHEADAAMYDAKSNGGDRVSMFDKEVWTRTIRRIETEQAASVYRDGEGRTRREQTLKAIGNFSP